MIERLIGIIKGAVRPALKTSYWLLRIMLPISLAMKVAQYYGVIDWLAQYLNVIFQYMGLPGSSSIAWLTGACVNTYAGLAVMLSMPMTLRQASIIAIMICLCHALPLEGAVVQKTGSRFMPMTLLRIMAAFVAGFLLNILLPEYPEPLQITFASASPDSLLLVLKDWFFSSLQLSAMIILLIYGLMLLQRILDDLGLMYILTKPLRPFMRLFGLPENSSYLWLVGNVLGLSYGSAMMIDLEESGQISREEANEVNYHLIMNHSMLEDTLVFVGVGVSAWWILGTRMLFAIVLVWSRKALKRLINMR
ncbi:MAG: nucleoside recognition domain-containing protein [Prevotella sp.]|nr:nucleoside recognition domain-containing protein [Prevotella sp.]